tara:strand:- start:1318 stop:1539 length:222 start_codon:yes stop_codon:yes gene_type:complete
MENKVSINQSIINKATNNKKINSNKRSIYDMYFDSIMRHNKIKVVSTEHDYNSEIMMTYFNKQKLKKKNFKKE